MSSAEKHHIYKLTFFDAEGEEMGKDAPFVRSPITDEEPRELQFMQVAKNAGAENYSVRMLRPKEIQQLLRDEAKERARARKQNFMNEMMRTLGGEAVFSTMLILNSSDNRRA